MSKSKHFKVQRKVLNLQPGADCTCTHVHHSPPLLLLLLMLLMWMWLFLSLLEEFVLAFVLPVPLQLQLMQLQQLAAKWSECQRKCKQMRATHKAKSKRRRNINRGLPSSEATGSRVPLLFGQLPWPAKWGQCSGLALPLLLSFNNINAH